MTSWTPRRRLAMLALLLAMAGSVLSGVLVSVWLLAPLPLLGAATYAIVLGMTPSRFVDALDDPSGSATQPPL